jgi:hypothetical protein
MQWLVLSAVLWLVLVVVGWRWWLRRKRRRSLCRNCQYDYLDICDLPQRPYAQECDTYLPIEDVEYEELDETEGSEWS